MAQERLYITNIWIPLTASLNPSITKSVTDITEPQDRKATYSKTVSIPRSKEADKIFTHLFEFNITTGLFNTSARAAVRYECDSEIILQGYIRLNKIGRANNNEITYDCTMFSTAADFMATISGAYLTDLYESTASFEGLDIYDHLLTKEIQQLSWATSVIKNSPASIPFEYGTGYVYALVDYGFSTDATNFIFTQIGPSIYEKEYLLRIINWAGYTLQSGGWVDTDDVINHLIIPSSPECYQLTASDISNREFVANTPELTSTGTTTSNILPIGSFSTPDIIIFTNDSVAPGTDPGLNYNPATGKFTCVATGVYDINALIDINATFDPNTGLSVKTVCDIHGFVEFYHTPFSTGTPVVVDSTPFYITHDHGFSIGVRSTDATPTYQDNDYMSGKAFGQLSQTIPLGRAVEPPDRYQLLATGIPLAAGDIVDVRWRAGVFAESLSSSFYVSSDNLFEDGFAAFHDGDVTLDMPVGVFYNKSANNTMTEGNTLQMVDVIPKNVKMFEYIQSLIRDFNLVVDVNPLNPKELVIKTKDDFYDNTSANAINIHELIDRSPSKPIEKYPVSTLNVKRYLYQRKPDNDYWNNRYTQNHQEVYGNRQVDVDNEFATADKKTESIFSPTCMVALPGSDRVLPTIYAVDDYNQPKTTKHNIRRLYYAGLKPCLNAWGHTNYVSVFGIPVTDYYTSYPYAGHWDDPFTPTLDINYGLVKEVFYDDNLNPIVFTNNNLINKYHSRDLRQLTDPESFIVKAWVHMRPYDFTRFTFEKLYYWDFAYWRLQEITNYNPAGNDTTECTFLKLVSVPDFVSSTQTATGKPAQIDPTMGGGNVVMGEQSPAKGTRTYDQPDNNSYISRSIDVKGQYNYVNVTAKNIEIYGDSNKVFSQANNIKIQGSGNIIEAGVTNVTLINTDNKTITESDVAYINGVQTTVQSNQIESISASQDWDPNVLMYLVDASGGNVSVDLDVVAYQWQEGQELNFYRLDNVAANLCRVTVTGCNIDVVSTVKGLSVQYNSFTLKFHDGDFYTVN